LTFLISFVFSTLGCQFRSFSRRLESPPPIKMFWLGIGVCSLDVAVLHRRGLFYIFFFCPGLPAPTCSGLLVFLDLTPTPCCALSPPLDLRTPNAALPAILTHNNRLFAPYPTPFFFDSRSPERRPVLTPPPPPFSHFIPPCAGFQIFAPFFFLPGIFSLHFFPRRPFAESGSSFAVG